MTIYSNSDQLYNYLKMLFNGIKEQGPEFTRSITSARMIIRLHCTTPLAEVIINGRQSPVQITYGDSPLRPDLDVELTADALHQILLAELPLRKAIAGGQMKVRGQLWKTPALEDILHRGQALYPQILKEQGWRGNGANGPISP